MKKRITAMLIVLVMLLGMMPGTVSAATTIPSVNLIYNVADFCLYTSSQEGVVNENIRLRTRTSTSGIRMISTANSGLQYKQGINTYIGTTGKTTPVVETRNYYIYIEFVPDEGYVWPEEISRFDATVTYIPITDLHEFRVFLNGKRYFDEGYVRLKSENRLVVSVPVANDITSITLSPATFIYDGKVKMPHVVSAKLRNGDPVSNYTVTYVNKDNRVVAPVNPGTYYAVLKGEGIYGTGRKEFTINKLKNAIIAEGKKVKVKASKIKNKKQVIKCSKSMGICTAVGKLQFKLAKVNKKKFKKYFKVNAKNGNITIKKGLKKGTYKLKINITAAGNANYLAATKQVMVTIKVK